VAWHAGRKQAESSCQSIALRGYIPQGIAAARHLAAPLPELGGGLMPVVLSAASSCLALLCRQYLQKLNRPVKLLKLNSLITSKRPHLLLEQ
jgi:hypothetical protein